MTLRIALPKGRLLEPSLATFAAAGYDVPTAEDLATRKLVFDRGDIEWIFVKDCDVPVYVDHGAADIGIAGLDQILEHACTAYQPVELPFGRCKLMLISAPGAPPLTKVATKYPRIAHQYLDKHGIRAEVIPLGGSVELSAVLQLTSHVIDLVETGETVRVHKLEMQETIEEISPRLIVGKNVYRTERERVQELIEKVRSAGIPAGRPASASEVADKAIAQIGERGDDFAREQIAKFDKVDVGDILIAPRDVTISKEMRDAIDLAIARIESFHTKQLPQSYRWNNVEHRVSALRRVGVYVPGGRAVYLSTLIMCAVPARIAGVREIVVITTPAAASRDELHYVCNRLGIKEIYQCGGAAGIAASALGTQTLERVDKIVGPGNSYVTAAKARLVGTVGIDMTAGPTELVVIADESAERDFVQADLDAQAEHGTDSVVTCISIGKPLDVRATRNIVAASVDEAIALTDQIAPEHASIHARDAASIAARLQNCGAIFCGPFSPVAAGDYIAGPNHVLPTGGSARFFSPLGVYDFVKRSNIVMLSAGELAEISEAGELIAEFEGLPKHAASMAVRRTACLATSSQR